MIKALKYNIFDTARHLWIKILILKLSLLFQIFYTTEPSRVINMTIQNLHCHERERIQVFRI